MNFQRRGSLPRLYVTCYHSHLYFSRLKSGLSAPAKSDINGSTISERQSGRFNNAFWYTGLGVAITALYYVLVNGTSRSARTSDTEPLSPSHFTPLKLTASTSCTPHTKLLTFSLPAHLIPEEAQGGIPPIFSMYVKDSDMQIERPYTPLEGIDAEGRVRFWVKRYQGGEVGQWLHERKVGDMVEMRGPVRNWDWQDGVWDEIVMISGGTGITPFYQLLSGAFAGETSLQTRYTLLHSSPTPLDLPPAQILEPLRVFARDYPNVFSLQIFVDTNEPQGSWGGPLNLSVGRIGRKALDEVLVRSRETPWWKWLWGGQQRKHGKQNILFLVCGPEPMTVAIAGPRGPNRGQGRAGGVLGEMGYENRQVWTL